MTEAKLSIVGQSGALSDEEVVARVRAGERELFEVLMRRYNQRLFRIARGVLRDAAEAEDVVQQAYISAFTHLHQFAGEARFSTWLTRIALNEALGRKRHHARLAEVDLAADGEHMSDLTVKTSGPEEQTATRELTGLLEAAIDELPEGYRVVFMMREVQEMSTAETAACLELTEEAVKVRLHRARGMLRESMFERIDEKAPETFSFLGARCDRIVAAVMDRIADLPLPGRAD